MKDFVECSDANVVPFLAVAKHISKLGMNQKIWLSGVKGMILNPFTETLPVDTLVISVV
jgi:hypothetical protein